MWISLSFSTSALSPPCCTEVSFSTTLSQPAAKLVSPSKSTRFKLPRNELSGSAIWDSRVGVPGIRGTGGGSCGGGVCTSLAANSHNFKDTVLRTSCARSANSSWVKNIDGSSELEHSSLTDFCASPSTAWEHFSCANRWTASRASSKMIEVVGVTMRVCQKTFFLSLSNLNTDIQSHTVTYKITNTIPTYVARGRSCPSNPSRIRMRPAA